MKIKYDELNNIPPSDGYNLVYKIVNKTSAIAILKNL